MNPEDMIEAHLRADEQIIGGAVDPNRPGTHWHWVASCTDTPVEPGGEAAALEDAGLSLRTVEEYPARVAGWTLPAFAIHDVNEGYPGALRHIAHFDPARMMREAQFKRKLLEECGGATYGVERLRGNPEIEDGYRRFHEGRLEALQQVIEMLADIYNPEESK